MFQKNWKLLEYTMNKRETFSVLISVSIAKHEYLSMWWTSVVNTSYFIKVIVPVKEMEVQGNLPSSPCPMDAYLSFLVIYMLIARIYF